MADIFIKNVNGQIWKNSDGVILKAKKFNEMPIQQGLSFWGAADPNYLTVIDGLVSEAYDIRGTGAKMIQNTVSARPVFNTNYLSFVGTGLQLQISLSGIRSIFLVFHSYAQNNPRLGFGYSDSSFIGDRVTQGHGMFVNAVAKTFYRNNTKYTSYVSPTNSFVIAHSFTNDLNVSAGFFLGASYPAAQISPCFVKEWGAYNRVLSEMEVIYNVNALNAKYSIF